MLEVVDLRLLSLHCLTISESLQVVEDKLLKTEENWLLEDSESSVPKLSFTVSSNCILDARSPSSLASWTFKASWSSELSFSYVPLQLEQFPD